MNMKTKVIAAILAALLQGGVWADTADTGIIEETGFTWSKTGPVVPGEWTSRYDEAMEMAKTDAIPLIAFFARRSCGNCKELERLFVEPQTVQWFKRRKFILLCGIEGESGASKVVKLSQKGSTLPFVGLYWDRNGDGKSDGKDGEVNNKEVRRGGSWKGKTSKDLMDWVESYFRDYNVYDGGQFEASDTEGDRLECEDGTTSVPVVLRRENGTGASSNKLVVRYPNGSCVTNAVAWAAGDTNKVVDVNVASAGFTADGQKIELELLSVEGIATGTNHITYAKRENSAANPLWTTERTDPYANGVAPTLAFGEWTMDLVAAKHLAEQEGGFTLVSIQGSMWCPDCANTDRNFLEVKNAAGENVFRQWARANKVALVAMDVPNYSASGSTPDSVASPTIFSKKAFATTLARAREYPESGADPALTNAIVRSGLGYLTRKGATDAQAAAVMADFHRLAVTNTEQGGFHRPEDTNAYRTGVPIFVLLRSDGSVAARFTRFASVSPMAADRANVETYLKRFDEMLAIAGAGASAHADATEIANNYPGSGAVPLLANGGLANGELCYADTRDTFRLEGFGGNALLRAVVRGECEAKVTVSFWQVAGGATNVVQIEGQPAVATGKLSDVDGVALERNLPAGEYYVDVQLADDPSAPGLTDATTNFVSYSVASSIVLAPSECAATAAAAEGTNVVSILLEAGVTYRIEGLDFDSVANSNALEWVTGGDGLLFRAKAGGTPELVLAENGGEITYQKWMPGTVGFEPVDGKGEITVKETDEVCVSYRRANGASGSVTVKVSLNIDETDFFYDWAPDADWSSKMLPRFKINGASTTNWSETVEWLDDGRPLESCVSNFVVTPGEFETQKISQYFGPGKVVFDLEIVSQTAAGVYTNTVDFGRFTINFTENQKPSAGRVEITKCDREWAKKLTVYARESEEVKVMLSRIDAAEGPVFADLTASGGSVKLGGDYDDILGVTWGNRDSLPKTVTVTNLPSAGKSVKLTLAATAPLKVSSSAKSVTIVSVADDAPRFELDMAGSTVYRYVAVSNVYAVTGTQGGELTFKKVSGSLPSGLKAVWNGDTAKPAMVITGVPTGKDGTEASAVFQVTETRGKTKVPGLAITLDFRLVDPAVSGGPGGAPLNASCAKSRTFKDLMVLQQMDDDTIELFGTMQLTLPSNGKASAKLLCETGTVSFAAKSWSGIAAEGDGSYTCTLVGKSAFSDWEVEVEALTNGAIRAELFIGGADAVSMPIEHSGVQWSSTHSASNWAGTYTVTFDDNKIGGFPDISGPGAGYASDGHAYLVLTMTSSQAKTGTMKWAGVLPNGTKVSGSSVLSEKGAEAAHLPFVKTSSKDGFSGVLAIERGGAGKEKDECWESVSCPMEDKVPLLTRWRHAEKSKKTDKGDFTARFRPYGGIYDSNLDLGCCCEIQRTTSDMSLTVDQPRRASDYYGEFGPVEPVTVTIGDQEMRIPDGGPNGITLKFNRKTGVVSGKFSLYDALGKKISAAYQGVVQLGFGNACGCAENPQPFVNGFWYVTDKIGYGDGNKFLSVKRGGRLVIDVPGDK